MNRKILPRALIFANLRVPCLLGLSVLFALAAVIVIYNKVTRPFFLQITDQAGPWYLTFSPVDLNLDGDLDVLVHNMRKPQALEAYSGGALWINQGGLQGGQAGQLALQPADDLGGWDSTTADLDGDGDLDAVVVGKRGGSPVVERWAGTVCAGRPTHPLLGPAGPDDWRFQWGWANRYIFSRVYPILPGVV